ncbi:MAG: hypothetical protein KAR37_11805 [Alphaproteobacteria bacterium]|nr:hypothetical protein [Alphaproteobacteria bacterium]
MNDTVNRGAVVAGLLAAPFYLTLIIVLGALEPGFRWNSGDRGFRWNSGDSIPIPAA